MWRSSAIPVLTIWLLSPLYSNTVWGGPLCDDRGDSKGRESSSGWDRLVAPPPCVSKLSHHCDRRRVSQEAGQSLLVIIRWGTKRSPWWWLKPGLALSTPPGGQIISHTLTSWHGQDVRDSSYICFAIDAKNSKFLKYNQQFPNQVFVKELQDHRTPQAAERW